MDDCKLCSLRRGMESGDDPWAVARLQSGYVGLNPLQYYRGYTFFSSKACVVELHELTLDERGQFLHEMVEVAHAVWRAFRPRKLNYEALGNSVSHLHWHIVPRHADDARASAPIWENLEFLRLNWTGVEEPDPEVRDRLVADLLTELRAADVVIESTFR